MSDVKVGMKVRHKRGGPEMVVDKLFRSVLDSRCMATCTAWIGGKFENFNVNIDMLDVIAEEEPAEVGDPLRNIGVITGKWCISAGDRASYGSTVWEAIVEAGKNLDFQPAKVYCPQGHYVGETRLGMGSGQLRSAKDLTLSGHHGGYHSIEIQNFIDAGGVVPGHQAIPEECSLADILYAERWLRTLSKISSITGVPYESEDCLKANDTHRLDRARLAGESKGDMPKEDQEQPSGKTNGQA